MKVDLNDRPVEFSVNTIKYIQTITYKEFIQKLRISLREANETIYWYKILSELKIGDSKKLQELSQEINEISKIPGAIVSKAHKNELAK